MGPLFYVMAIMGCGDGQSACEQVRLIETHYASPDACTASVPAMLMNATDLSFPEVTAECRPAGASLAVAKDAPRG